MKCLKGHIIFFILLFFFSCYFFGLPPQKGPANASLTTVDGLHIVNFQTPHGKIGITLPDDMALGDVISGQLSLQPVGKKEKAKAKNMKKLADYILEAGEQKTAAGNGWVKWTIPDVKELSIVLLNEKGKPVSRIQVPVLQEPPEERTADFRCPEVGIAGTIFQYFGEFDGDFSDTDGHIGDREIKKWAESPRKLVLDSPRDILGSTTLNIKEGDEQDTCEYRNISIQAAAGKHRLLKGESTTLTVTVRGLEGLEEEIPLNLENKTPNIVSMKGEGTFFIHPGDVQPGGVYTTTRRITGIMPGGFHISAAVPLDSVRCKHDSFEFDDITILSDDCKRVIFKGWVRYCERGKWKEWKFFPRYQAVTKYEKLPDGGKLCELAIVSKKKGKRTKYYLYHHNGKRWVKRAYTSVDKGD